LAFHFDDQFPAWVMNTYWFQSMKAAHMRHHFRDNGKEFGVTLDLWDRILGTKVTSVTSKAD
jgi:sterol desaturase/sphingolipid hydroxylase (fatty acid hydroxylase superfamily)